MRRKILEKYDAEDDEAFNKYLLIVVTNIIELNKKMEEVD